MKYILVIFPIIFLIACQTLHKDSSSPSAREEQKKIRSPAESSQSIHSAVTLNCDQSPAKITSTVSDYLAQYGLENGVTDFRAALYRNLDDVRYLVQLNLDLQKSKERYDSVWRRLQYNSKKKLKEANLSPMGFSLAQQLTIEKEALKKQVAILNAQKLAQNSRLQSLLLKTDSRIKYGTTLNPFDIHEESFYLDIPLENGKFLAGEPNLQFDCSVKYIVRNRAKISLNMQSGKVHAFLYDGTSECAAAYSVSVVGVIDQDFKKQCSQNFYQKTLITYKLGEGALGDNVPIY